MTNRWENTGNSDRLFFLSSKITADGDFSHEIKRRLILGRKAMTNLDSILKSRHYLADKGLSIQSYDFSSSPVWMWELDHKESWALKNWCFWTVVLEKTLESPLDCKGIQWVNPKGNQSWIFIGRTDAEAPVLIHLMRRTDSLEQTLMLGKIEGRRRRKWLQSMRWLDGHEFEQAPGVGDGQGGLACCSPWGRKELDTNDWATELNWCQLNVQNNFKLSEC